MKRRIYLIVFVFLFTMTSSAFSEPQQNIKDQSSSTLVPPTIDVGTINDGGEEYSSESYKSFDTQSGVANDGFPKMKAKAAYGTTIYKSTWYAGADCKVVDMAVSTGETTTSKEFVRYLTSSWAKASSYTWSQSQSVSWQISAGLSTDIANNVRGSLGLSASRTTTYGVSVTIPASSSYYSKLGFASDYFVQYYKYTCDVQGTITKSESGYIKTPTANSYLIVYKQ